MTTTGKRWPPVETEQAVVHPKAPSPGTTLRSHYDECFGCGPEQQGGLKIVSTLDEDNVVRATFTVGDGHQGAPGLAHGGLLACAFDEALGTACGQLLRVPVVTGRLETDFVKPVPVGSTLHIEVRIDGVAGRKIYVTGNGHLDAVDGPLAVRARGLFVEVKIEHFTTNGDAAKIRGMAKRRWDVNP